MYPVIFCLKPFLIEDYGSRNQVSWYQIAADLISQGLGAELSYWSTEHNPFVMSSRSEKDLRRGRIDRRWGKVVTQRQGSACPRHISRSATTWGLHVVRAVVGGGRGQT